jgi:hypothetical protein
MERQVARGKASEKSKGEVQPSSTVN